MLDFLKDVRFEPIGHTYHLGNRELVSVTTVLKEAGLVDDRWFTEEARLRGEYVHSAIALLHEDALEDASIDPVIAPYFEGYRRFLAETQIRVDHVEGRVFNEVLGLAGTFDVLGQFPLEGPGRDLIDIKSGHVPRTVGLQLAGYVRCLPPGGAHYRRWSLNLPGDGGYRLERHTNRQDDAVFLAALTVAQWKRGQS